MSSDFSFYASIALRRSPLFVLVALAIASIGVALAVLLPTVYTASGRLLVEDPQIPTNLAQSTVQVDELEQLRIIEQQVLTRATLLAVAREHEVYEDLATMNADQIVARMRSDTTMNSSGRRNDATLMVVSFRARNGAIAADVTNDFITRILALNAEQRQSRAGQTLDFFQQEVERLETELSLRNEDILRFQNENSGALPATLSFRMERQGALQNRLAQIERERQLLQDRREDLELLRDSGEADAAALDGQVSPQAQRLSALQAELTAARSVYAEQSPTVRLLVARIAALEAQIAQEAAPSDTAEAQTGLVSAPDPLQRQIDDVEDTLGRLAEEAAVLEEELESLRRSIERTPANAITLQALERDYEYVLSQHQSAMNRLAQASTGERIETLGRGQRITVIEQATVPDEPSDPNRPLIAGAGVAAGLGSATVLIALLEFLNQSIRRPADLTHALGITPLVTLPYVPTRWERLRRRLIGLLGISVLVVGIPAALWFVHYEIMPLDLIYDRIVSALTL